MHKDFCGWSLENIGKGNVETEINRVFYRLFRA